MHSAPVASCAKVESTRVGPQVRRNMPTFPARLVLTAYIRALPGAPGLLATVIGETRERLRQLDPSVGGSGPRGLAVRADAARLAAPTRPSHPAPNVRDDGARPSCGCGMRQDNHIFPKNGSGIFGRGGVERPKRLNYRPNIFFARTSIRVAASRRSVSHLQKPIT
jgi:hypothetical protein